MTRQEYGKDDGKRAVVHDYHVFTAQSMKAMIFQRVKERPLSSTLLERSEIVLAKEGGRNFFKPSDFVRLRKVERPACRESICMALHSLDLAFSSREYVLMSLFQLYPLCRRLGSVIVFSHERSD